MPPPTCARVPRRTSLPGSPEYAPDLWQSRGMTNALPPQYAPQPPAHPQATTVLILGILGLVLCQLIAPFAWIMGRRVVTEIDASQGQYGGRTEAQAGKVMGIIGTVLIGLGLLVALVVLVGVAVGAMTGSIN